MIFKTAYDGYQYRKPVNDHQIEIRVQISKSALEKVIQDAFRHPEF